MAKKLILIFIACASLFLLLNYVIKDKHISRLRIYPMLPHYREDFTLPAVFTVPRPYISSNPEIFFKQFRLVDEMINLLNDPEFQNCLNVTVPKCPDEVSFFDIINQDDVPNNYKKLQGDYQYYVSLSSVDSTGQPFVKPDGTPYVRSTRFSYTCSTGTDQVSAAPYILESISMLSDFVSSIKTFGDITDIGQLTGVSSDGKTPVAKSTKFYDASQLALLLGYCFHYLSQLLTTTASTACNSDKLDIFFAFDLLGTIVSLQLPPYNQLTPIVTYDPDNNLIYFNKTLYASTLKIPTSDISMFIDSGTPSQWRSIFKDMWISGKYEKYEYFRFVRTVRELVNMGPKQKANLFKVDLEQDALENKQLYLDQCSTGPLPSDLASLSNPIAYSCHQKIWKMAGCKVDLPDVPLPSSPYGWASGYLSNTNGVTSTSKQWLLEDAKYRASLDKYASVCYGTSTVPEEFR